MLRMRFWPCIAESEIRQLSVSEQVVGNSRATHHDGEADETDVGAALSRKE